MKLFEKIFRKKTQRKECFYVRKKNNFTFTFYSNIELSLSEETLQSIFDIITDAKTRGLSGDDTAKMIFEQLRLSNQKIRSLEISCESNGKNWLIEVSTSPLAFQD